MYQTWPRSNFSVKTIEGKRFLGFIPACDTNNHEIINTTSFIQYLQLPLEHSVLSRRYQR